MEGEKWMEIRSDYKKRLPYTKIGQKHNIDWRTAKKYCHSDQKPEYELTDPKGSKLDKYKPQMDTWLEEAPYSAVRIHEKLQEHGADCRYTIVRNYVATKATRFSLMRSYVISLTRVFEYVQVISANQNTGAEVEFDNVVRLTVDDEEVGSGRTRARQRRALTPDEPKVFAPVVHKLVRVAAEFDAAGVRHDIAVDQRGPFAPSVVLGPFGGWVEYRIFVTNDGDGSGVVFLEDDLFDLSILLEDIADGIYIAAGETFRVEDYTLELRSAAVNTVTLTREDEEPGNNASATVTLRPRPPVVIPPTDGDDDDDDEDYDGDDVPPPPVNNNPPITDDNTVVNFNDDNVPETITNTDTDEEYIVVQNEDGEFLVFDFDGVPLGVLIPPNTEVNPTEDWVFDYQVPLSTLPQTGEMSVSIGLGLMGFLLIGSGLIMKKRSKFTVKM